MNGLVFTLLSVLVAAVVAASLGALLGRLGATWNPGRALVNLLTQARGALLPFVLTPVLATLGLPEWCAIGLAAGATQAIATARWILRQNSDWSTALLGSIALGQSGPRLAAESARRRGAVTATLALSVVQVVTLEALAAWIHGGAAERQTLGAMIATGSESRALLGWLVLAALLLAVETLASWLLQGRAPALWSAAFQRR